VHFRTSNRCALDAGKLNSGIIGEKGRAELHFLQCLRAYAFKILGITITLDSFTGRCWSVSFKESRHSLLAVVGHAGDDVGIDADSEPIVGIYRPAEL